LAASGRRPVGQNDARRYFAGAMRGKPPNGRAAAATARTKATGRERAGVQERQRKHLMVIAPCFAAIAIMCALVAYSPVLYRMFCAATGLAGTTQRVAADTAQVSEQTVRVAFDTNVAPGLPWRFVPDQRAVTVHLGEQKLVYFTAENLSNQAIVGHATFNVTPLRTGIYFNKIQCFCFTEERLDAHEKVDMPVVFYVDPAFGKDADMHDVAQITLGYTFFRSADPHNAKDLSRFLAGSPPDPAYGRELFNEQCATCHALDANKYGPKLGGVFGRRAGAAPGYDYSAALAKAGPIWSADNLERWLAGPRQFIPGAKMPVSVPDPIARRDIIAYLQQETEQRAARSKTKTAATRSGS
jgi:cytochrome c oxidase assembly protein subunit 11